MPKNPPEGSQRIIPYLTYADASAAIGFLTQAFGFSEEMRMDMPDGRIGHAELRLDDCIIMLADAFPEMGLKSPQDLPAVHSQIMCYVDDVDAHHATARAHGAAIDSPPEDQFWGDRMYRVRDLEGHRWMFSTHVRDVAPEDMKMPG